ncbi:hypothetical protein CAPSP0001_0987 [Capnocytophaga sputigena ATCC 33612]|nr:hypothetical protein CAPSP0001_0987 [Capnocytophaga sputigena ATCC 33612]
MEVSNCTSGSNCQNGTVFVNGKLFAIKIRNKPNKNHYEY